MSNPRRIWETYDENPDPTKYHVVRLTDGGSYYDAVGGTGGGGTSGPTALQRDNGSDPAVTAGSTVTLITYLAPASIVGFVLSGEADGIWSVQVDGVEIYEFRTDVVEQSKQVTLPGKDVISSGTITLKVKNNGAGTAAFKGAMLRV